MIVRHGFGDANSAAAAANDAVRGGAGSPQVAVCPWAGDSSYSSDPAGQILAAYANGNSQGTMYADSWSNFINYYQVPGSQMWVPNTVSPSGKVALAGRVAPMSSQLGLTGPQLGCEYDMELTIGQYWAAFKAYNNGAWKPPGQMCSGTPTAASGPTSPTLYPNIYVSPTWSGNASTETDAQVQAQYKANMAAAAKTQAATAAATNNSASAGGNAPVAGGSNTTNSTASQTDGTTQGVSSSWLEQTFSLAGYNVPYWAALAVVGVGAFMVMKKGR